MAQIKGTITRAYREGDRSFVHVRPADPEELRYIDGSKRCGDGTIRQELDDGPDDDEGLAASVGKETSIEVESAKDEEAETPRRSSGRRRPSSPAPTE